MTSFSIVSAVYDVARYLDDFLGDLDAQDHPHDLVEVVLVDDGSTDDSLDRIRTWADRTDLRVTVLTQPNGGQASARNLGLEHATGDWVTFTDPDDRLDPTYLSRIAAFLAQHPGADLAAAALWVLDDATGELTDTHPMRARYAGGDRLVDLGEHGDHFFGSANAGFFRRDRLERLALRFDPRIRPNFEDAHFVGRYLLEGEPARAPVVGFVGSARYHYRKRSDATSTLQRSYDDPGRYTAVVEHGYLDLLRRGAAQHGGAAPRWVQEQVIYDVSWTLSMHDARDGNTAAKGPVADRFHELMREVTALLDDQVVEEFAWRRLKREWRALLAHGYDDDPWHSQAAVSDVVDPEAGLVRVSYHYVGEPPPERVWVGDEEVVPRHAKHRDIVALEQVRVRERLMWLPAHETARLEVGGAELAIVTQRPRNVALVREPRRAPTRKERLLRRVARSRLLRRRLAGSWVLVDRAHDADDSAEHLFHYLRAHRPEINAWFTVEKGTADWRRLRREAGRRLVPFGSLRWKLVMLNADHVVSSHAENLLVRPPSLAFTAPTWRFAFLQHGVIKDDLSAWLNRKPIDVFVTSTPAERDSVVRDGSGYRFTSKEVVLSGMPRFDRLLAQAAAVAPEDRDLVLVAPTWRAWLVDRPSQQTHRRSLEEEAVDSDFVRAWLGLLADPALAAACREHGLRLGFLPHPNMQPLLDRIELPSHVEPIRYAGTDVRDLIARSRLLITDFSSMAFNAGYVDRPVLYYQFDADRVRDQGSHVGRPDYFDYERDGFGPVVAAHEAAVRTAVAMIDAGALPAEEYRARSAATFTLRDGRASERVTDFIVASARPARRPDVVAPLAHPGGQLPE